MREVPEQGTQSHERGPLSYERGPMSHERVPLSYEHSAGKCRVQDSGLKVEG
jgi:hypothetical protein